MKRRSSGPTLREKIGQMLLLGFRGWEIGAGDPIVRDLTEGNLGAVILYDQEVADPSRQGRNIQSPQQLRRLIDSLQKNARTPLFVAVDQEGGKVNRLKPEYGFPASLSHQELGTLNQPEQTYVHAQNIAQTLAEVGINMNLAPVVDLAICSDNPIIQQKQRSFSSDPGAVARHALEFVRAHRECGIVTCPKHFPGHGSAHGDTHLGLVDVTAHWTEKELGPFQRLIEAGQCDAIMTAHVFNRNLDPARPATLSQTILQGLLRKRLRFDGVILSDDMEMKAISAKFGLADAIKYGIQAGLDILCFGNNMNYDPEIGVKASRIIEDLVKSGAIAESRVDESYERIQNLKRKFHII